MGSLCACQPSVQTYKTVDSTHLSTQSSQITSLLLPRKSDYIHSFNRPPQANRTLLYTLVETQSRSAQPIATKTMSTLQEAETTDQKIVKAITQLAQLPYTMRREAEEANGSTAHKAEVEAWIETHRSELDKRKTVGVD